MLNIVGIGTYESRYKGSASGKKAGCNSVAVSASGIIMKFLLCIRLIAPLKRRLEVLYQPWRLNESIPQTRIGTRVYLCCS